MAGQSTPSATPPPELRAPGSPPSRIFDAPRRHLWVWVLLGLLLLAALAVVFALPSLLSPVENGVAPVQTAPPAANTLAARERAQKILERYLQLRAKMELEHAAVWGQPDWNAASTRVSSGDHYFSQRQFAAAGREYGQALERLRKLEARRTTLLETALENGRRALTADDVRGAVEAFEAALQIEPGHEQATAGILKARHHAAVLDQMKLGREAETLNDIEGAQRAYREAVRLDAGYVAAVAALEKVSSEIDERRFNQKMTATLRALDAGNTTAAGQALTDAGRLRPDDPAVRDARARLQSMRVQAGLKRLRRQVSARVGEEDWRAAVRLYRKALEIDSSAGFARVGLNRAEERVKLHAQFDHYLDKPTRLYAAAPLENAERLLASVNETASSEPRLADKIAQLHALVVGARTPVRVTLKSDGKTDLVIYRVARLGTLVTRELELRPGDYTVVGSRTGYRDVRRVVRVRPGKPVPSFTIRCEETI